MSIHDGFDSASEALKTRHRPLFLEMQRANRAWPGGVTEGLKVMGAHPIAALASFAPDEYDKAPGLLLLLDYLEYFKPRSVVHYIASLADCITVPDFTARAAYPSRKAAAEALAVHLRTVLYSLDLASGTPTLAQRQAMQADLLQLISAAHAMYLKLNG